MVEPTFKVDPNLEFQKSIDKATKELSDLTIPLTLISQDFYKSEKAIFQLKSPGQYPDLTASTKRQKRKLGYQVYPILKRTGRLEQSLTQPDSNESINQIQQKKTLIIGTRVPYATYHQNGSGNLPERKVLFIGPEAPRFATSEMVGRPSRWINILENFVIQVSSEFAQESA